MTEARPKVEIEKAAALYSSVLPNVRDDGLFPDIALDSLNPKYELVDEVQTAISGFSDGETSPQDR